VINFIIYSYLSYVTDSLVFILYGHLNSRQMIIWSQSNTIFWTAFFMPSCTPRLSSPQV